MDGGRGGFIRYAFQSPSTKARAALGSLISKFAVMLDVAILFSFLRSQVIQGYNSPKAKSLIL